MIKETKKRFLFVDTEERHARLKIRLEYDGMTRSEFFRLFVTGYLEHDENILIFIENYVAQKALLNKMKRHKSKKLMEKRLETIDQFGLNDKDIENIFDVMEKEHPDL